MIVREHVSLKTLTSFRAGGTVRFVIEVLNENEVREALLFAHTKKLPWYPLGEGSNVLAKEEGYQGVVIIPRLTEFSFEGDTVIAGAGVSWDELVKEVGSRKLWGLENLAGIPGTVGAAPIQNIGAYGVEAKDSIVFVEALNVATHTIERLNANACEFSYRDSKFKREGGYVILRVSFRVSPHGAANISYPDLIRAKEAGVSLGTPSEVGEAVRAIRARKFPDLSRHGTAGSFFKNPVISEEAFQELKSRYEDLPGYDAPSGRKVSLAFILDKVLGLRGYRRGNAWLYDQQPLVLVLDAGGTADEVATLADEVATRVFDATKIKIEREVRAMA